MWKGTLVSIQVTSGAAQALETVGEARVLAGKGIEGDRYGAGAGTFSKGGGTGRHVTLIEAEALEALEREYSIKLSAVEARRNLLTRGVPLNHLVGREFRVGEVVLRGMRLCEPCSHLEGLTLKGVQKGLAHRGGLRTEVVREGVVRAGDAIEPLDA